MGGGGPGGAVILEGRHILERALLPPPPPPPPPTVPLRGMGGDHCQNSHPLFNYQGGGGGGGVSEVGGGGGVMQCYRLWQGKSKFHSIPIPISCHTVGNQSFSIVGV